MSMTPPLFTLLTHEHEPGSTPMPRLCAASLASGCTLPRELNPNPNPNLNPYPNPDPNPNPDPAPAPNPDPNRNYTLPLTLTLVGTIPCRTRTQIQGSVQLRLQPDIHSP